MSKVEEFKLPETLNYRVVITQDDNDNACYGIENKTTEVVEYRDSIFIRTARAIEQFEKNHNEYDSDHSEIVRPTTAEVTKIIQ